MTATPAIVAEGRSLSIGHGDALDPTLGTLAWLIGLLLIFGVSVRFGGEPVAAIAG